MSALRILSLNLNYDRDKHGPWPERLKLITRLLRREKPEVLVLQAVHEDRDGGHNQVEEIRAAASGYEHVYFKGLDRFPRGAADGQAVLSKLPLEECGFLPLSRVEGQDEDPARRLVLHVRLTHDGRPIQIYNCHFSWVESQNVHNLEETLHFVQKRDEYPSIAIGDFNVTPENAALEFLRQAGWTDVWQELHPSDPGFTFESNAPNKRIDYAWVNPAASAAVKDLRIVATGDGNGTRMSDHLGILLALD